MTGTPPPGEQRAAATEPRAGDGFTEHDASGHWTFGARRTRLRWRWHVTRWADVSDDRGPARVCAYERSGTAPTKWRALQLARRELAALQEAVNGGASPPPRD
jgi:hypothetical protein